MDGAKKPKNVIKVRVDDLPEDKDLLIETDEESVDGSAVQSPSQIMQEQPVNDEITDSELFECESDFNIDESNAEIDINDLMAAGQAELFCGSVKNITDNQATYEDWSLKDIPKDNDPNDVDTDEEYVEGAVGTPLLERHGYHVLVEDPSSVTDVSETVNDFISPSNILGGGSSFELQTSKEDALESKLGDGGNDRKMSFVEALTDLEDFSDADGSVFSSRRSSVHRLSVGSAYINIIHLDSDNEAFEEHDRRHRRRSSLLNRQAALSPDLSDYPATDEEDFTGDEDTLRFNNPHSVKNSSKEHTETDDSGYVKRVVTKTTYTTSTLDGQEMTPEQELDAQHAKIASVVSVLSVQDSSQSLTLCKSDVILNSFKGTTERHDLPVEPTAEAEDKPVPISERISFYEQSVSSSSQPISTEEIEKEVSKILEDVERIEHDLQSSTPAESKDELKDEGNEADATCTSVQEDETYHEDTDTFDDSVIEADVSDSMIKSTEMKVIVRTVEPGKELYEMRTTKDVENLNKGGFAGVDIRSHTSDDRSMTSTSQFSELPLDEEELTDSGKGLFGSINVTSGETNVDDSFLFDRVYHSDSEELSQKCTKEYIDEKGVKHIINKVLIIKQSHFELLIDGKPSVNDNYDQYVDDNGIIHGHLTRVITFNESAATKEDMLSFMKENPVEKIPDEPDVLTKELLYEMDHITKTILIKRIIVNKSVYTFLENPEVLDGVDKVFDENGITYRILTRTVEIGQSESFQNMAHIFKATNCEDIPEQPKLLKKKSIKTIRGISILTKQLTVEQSKEPESAELQKSQFRDDFDVLNETIEYIVKMSGKYEDIENYFIDFDMKQLGDTDKLVEKHVTDDKTSYNIKRDADNIQGSSIEEVISTLSTESDAKKMDATDDKVVTYHKTSYVIEEDADRIQDSPLAETVSTVCPDIEMKQIEDTEEQIVEQVTYDKTSHAIEEETDRIQDSPLAETASTVCPEIEKKQIEDTEEQIVEQVTYDKTSHAIEEKTDRIQDSPPAETVPTVCPEIEKKQIEDTEEQIVEQVTYDKTSHVIEEKTDIIQDSPLAETVSTVCPDIEMKQIDDTEELIVEQVTYDKTSHAIEEETDRIQDSPLTKSVSIVCPDIEVKQFENTDEQIVEQATFDKTSHVKKEDTDKIQDSPIEENVSIVYPDIEVKQFENTDEQIVEQATFDKTSHVKKEDTDKIQDSPIEGTVSTSHPDIDLKQLSDTDEQIGEQITYDETPCVIEEDADGIQDSSLAEAVSTVCTDKEVKQLHSEEQIVEQVTYDETPRVIEEDTDKIQDSPLAEVVSTDKEVKQLHSEEQIVEQVIYDKTPRVIEKDTDKIQDSPLAEVVSTDKEVKQLHSEEQIVEQVIYDKTPRVIEKDTDKIQDSPLAEVVSTDKEVKQLHSEEQIVEQVTYDETPRVIEEDTDKIQDSPLAEVVSTDKEVKQLHSEEQIVEQVTYDETPRVIEEDTDTDKIHDSPLAEVVSTDKEVKQLHYEEQIVEQVTYDETPRVIEEDTDKIQDSPLAEVVSTDKEVKQLHSEEQIVEQVIYDKTPRVIEKDTDKIQDSPLAEVVSTDKEVKQLYSEEQIVEQVTCDETPRVIEEDTDKIQDSPLAEVVSTDKEVKQLHSEEQIVDQVTYDETPRVIEEDTDKIQDSPLAEVVSTDKEVQQLHSEEQIVEQVTYDETPRVIEEDTDKIQDSPLAEVVSTDKEVKQLHSEEQIVEQVTYDETPRVIEEDTGSIQDSPLAEAVSTVYTDKEVKHLHSEEQIVEQVTYDETPRVIEEDTDKIQDSPLAEVVSTDKEVKQLHSEEQIVEQVTYDETPRVIEEDTDKIQDSPLAEAVSTDKEVKQLHSEEQIVEQVTYDETPRVIEEETDSIQDSPLAEAVSTDKEVKQLHSEEQVTYDETPRVIEEDTDSIQRIEEIVSTVCIDSNVKQLDNTDEHVVEQVTYNQTFRIIKEDTDKIHPIEESVSILRTTRELKHLSDTDDHEVKQITFDTTSHVIEEETDRIQDSLRAETVSIVYPDIEVKQFENTNEQIVEQVTYDKTSHVIKEPMDNIQGSQIEESVSTLCTESDQEEYAMEILEPSKTVTEVTESIKVTSKMFPPQQVEILEGSFNESGVEVVDEQQTVKVCTISDGSDRVDDEPTDVISGTVSDSLTMPEQAESCDRSIEKLDSEEDILQTKDVSSISVSAPFDCTSFSKTEDFSGKGYTGSGGSFEDEDVKKENFQIKEEDILSERASIEAKKTGLDEVPAQEVVEFSKAMDLKEETELKSIADKNAMELPISSDVDIGYSSELTKDSSGEGASSEVRFGETYGYENFPTVSPSIDYSYEDKAQMDQVTCSYDMMTRSTKSENGLTEKTEDEVPEIEEDVSSPRDVEKMTESMNETIGENLPADSQPPMIEPPSEFQNSVSFQSTEKKVPTPFEVQSSLEVEIGSHGSDTQDNEKQFMSTDEGLVLNQSPMSASARVDVYCRQSLYEVETKFSLQSPNTDIPVTQPLNISSSSEILHSANLSSGLDNQFYSNKVDEPSSTDNQDELSSVDKLSDSESEPTSEITKQPIVTTPISERRRRNSDSISGPIDSIDIFEDKTFAKSSSDEESPVVSEPEEDSSETFTKPSRKYSTPVITQCDPDDKEDVQIQPEQLTSSQVETVLTRPSPEESPSSDVSGEISPVVEYPPHLTPDMQVSVGMSPTELPEESVTSEPENTVEHEEPQTTEHTTTTYTTTTHITKTISVESDEQQQPKTVDESAFDNAAFEGVERIDSPFESDERPHSPFEVIRDSETTTTTTVITNKVFTTTSRTDSEEVPDTLSSQEDGESKPSEQILEQSSETKTEKSALEPLELAPETEHESDKILSATEECAPEDVQMIVERDEEEEEMDEEPFDSKVVTTEIVEQVKVIHKRPPLNQYPSEISEEDLVEVPQETDMQPDEPVTQFEEVIQKETPLENTKPHIVGVTTKITEETHVKYEKDVVPIPEVTDSDNTVESELTKPEMRPSSTDSEKPSEVIMREKRPKTTEKVISEQVEVTSSSGESHYYSFDTESGRSSQATTGTSRPTSSEFDVTLISGQASSEYDTCVTSQETTGPSSYNTAHTSDVSFVTAQTSFSNSSRDSTRSGESESSGHLGSFEMSSEASETLVPSALEEVTQLEDNVIAPASQSFDETPSQVEEESESSITTVRTITTTVTRNVVTSQRSVDSENTDSAPNKFSETLVSDDFDTSLHREGPGSYMSTEPVDEIQQNVFIEEEEEEKKQAPEPSSQNVTVSETIITTTVNVTQPESLPEDTSSTEEIQGGAMYPGDYEETDMQELELKDLESSRPHSKAESFFSRSDSDQRPYSELQFSDDRPDSEIKELISQPSDKNIEEEIERPPTPEPPEELPDKESWPSDIVEETYTTVITEEFVETLPKKHTVAKGVSTASGVTELAHKTYEHDIDEPETEFTYTTEYERTTYDDEIYPPDQTLETVQEENFDLPRKGGGPQEADDQLIETESRSTPDSDIVNRRVPSRGGYSDAGSASSLQEFEKLEQEVYTRKSSGSLGSSDSLNDKHQTKGSDRDDNSVSSLTEFEKLENQCVHVEKVEKPAAEEHAQLSEIDEGHESQASDSQETISEGGHDDTTNNSDYDKRMYEIDEIIRQAQSNVEHFEGSEPLPRVPLEEYQKKPSSSESLNDKTPQEREPDTDSLNGGDIPELDIDQTEIQGKVVDAPQPKKFEEPEEDSLHDDHAIIGDVPRDHPHDLDEDSLKEEKMVPEEGDDSLQEEKKKDFEPEDIDRDSLHDDKSEDSLQEERKKDFEPEDIDNDSLKEEEMVLGDTSSSGRDFDVGMMTSTGSLDRSSSAATHATYQYETDSIMSSSLQSGEESTMMSSTDAFDPEGKGLSFVPSNYEPDVRHMIIEQEIDRSLIDSEGNIRTDRLKSYTDQEGNIRTITTDEYGDESMLFGQQFVQEQLKQTTITTIKQQTITREFTPTPSSEEDRPSSEQVELMETSQMTEPEDEDQIITAVTSAISDQEHSALESEEEIFSNLNEVRKIKMEQPKIKTKETVNEYVDESGVKHIVIRRLIVRKTIISSGQSEPMDDVDEFTDESGVVHKVLQRVVEFSASDSDDKISEYIEQAPMEEIPDEPEVQTKETVKEYVDNDNVRHVIIKRLIIRRITTVSSSQAEDLAPKDDVDEVIDENGVVRKVIRRYVVFRGSDASEKIKEYVEKDPLDEIPDEPEVITKEFVKEFVDNKGIKHVVVRRLIVKKTVVISLAPEDKEAEPRDDVEESFDGELGVIRKVICRVVVFEGPDADKKRKIYLQNFHADDIPEDPETVTKEESNEYTDESGVQHVVVRRLVVKKSVIKYIGSPVPQDDLNVRPDTNWVVHHVITRVVHLPADSTSGDIIKYISEHPMSEIPQQPECISRQSVDEFTDKNGVSYRIIRKITVRTAVFSVLPEEPSDSVSQIQDGKIIQRTIERVILFSGPDAYDTMIEYLRYNKPDDIPEDPETVTEEESNEYTDESGVQHVVVRRLVVKKSVVKYIGSPVPQDDLNVRPDTNGVVHHVIIRVVHLPADSTSGDIIKYISEHPMSEIPQQPECISRQSVDEFTDKNGVSYRIIRKITVRTAAFSVLPEEPSDSVSQIQDGKIIQRTIERVIVFSGPNAHDTMIEYLKNNKPESIPASPETQIRQYVEESKDQNGHVIQIIKRIVIVRSVSEIVQEPNIVVQEVRGPSDEWHCIIKRIIEVPISQSDEEVHKLLASLDPKDLAVEYGSNPDVEEQVEDYIDKNNVIHRIIRKTTFRIITQETQPQWDESEDDQPKIQNKISQQFVTRIVSIFGTDVHQRIVTYLKTIEACTYKDKTGIIHKVIRRTIIPGYTEEQSTTYDDDSADFLDSHGNRHHIIKKIRVSESPDGIEGSFAESQMEQYLVQKSLSYRTSKTVRKDEVGTEFSKLLVAETTEDETVNIESYSPSEGETKIPEFVKKTCEILPTEKIFEESCVTEGGETRVTRTVTRHMVMGPEIETIEFRGDDADQKMQQYVDKVGGMKDEDVEQYQETDEDGNIHTIRRQTVVQPEIRTVTFTGPDAQRELDEFLSSMDETFEYTRCDDTLSEASIEGSQSAFGRQFSQASSSMATSYAEEEEDQSATREHTADEMMRQFQSSVQDGTGSSHVVTKTTTIIDEDGNPKTVTETVTMSGEDFNQDMAAANQHIAEAYDEQQLDEQ
ncbi:hypothetical protein GQR58_014906 [Nymphon striatum]|nr:hypothetical protein GQR58_014906 [Nymphon striatum]